MDETDNYYIHNAFIVNEGKLFQGDILVKEGKIARIMGKSRRQVEMLLYRAKAALKTELTKEGFSYENQ